MNNTSSPSIRIHQALYGYHNGHKLLSSSRELTSGERYTLLQFTDRSDDLDKIEKSGYLTGLPLSNEGVYALIRTWPAPEMERSGAVWSQVFLLDFHDLALISDLLFLNELFRRPSKEGALSSSAMPLTVIPDGNATGKLSQIDALSARILLERLYGGEANPAFLHKNELQETDALVLSIWSQQWARLRRSFRFCTHTQKDRSTQKYQFDLQIGPDRKWKRKSSGDDQSYSEDNGLSSLSGDWIRPALDDLMGESTRLRSFLKTMASDIHHGRRHFRFLCQVFQAFESPETNNLSWVLTAGLRRFTGDDASVLKRRLILEGLSNISSVSPDALDLIVQRMRLVGDEAIEEYAVPLGVRLWRHDIGIFADLPRNSAVWARLGDIVDALEPQEAIEGLSSNETLIDEVIPQVPHLLTEPSLWRAPIAERALAVLSELDNESALSTALAAICEAEALDLADDVSAGIAPHIIQDTLLKNHRLLDTGVGARLAIDVCTSVNNPADWFTALVEARSEGLNKTLLADFSQRLGPYTPDQCRRNDEVDIWAKAWALAKSDLPPDRQLPMMVFLFLRGMKAASANAATLIGYSLDDIVSAQSAYAINWDQLRALRSVLETPSLFEFCADRERLFRSVARKAKQEQFSPAAFLSLSASATNIHEIARCLSLKPSGRDYLSALIVAASNEFGDIDQGEKLEALRTAIESTAL